ncbi:MAG: rhodanese [Acidobacteria bacterium]|nr:MAG: rhodanese [Acidobacteriota bacterium]
MMTSQTQFRKNDPAKAKEFFLDKITFTTGPVELSHALEQGADIVVVDVRAEEDYQKGHIPGAINLPQEKWDTYEGLSRDKFNVLCCYSAVCHLAATAAVQFASEGFSVMEMDGGFEAWKENDLKVEKGQRAVKAATSRRQPVAV